MTDYRAIFGGEPVECEPINTYRIPVKKWMKAEKAITKSLNGHVYFGDEGDPERIAREVNISVEWVYRIYYNVLDNYRGEADAIALPEICERIEKIYIFNIGINEMTKKILNESGEKLSDFEVAYVKMCIEKQLEEIMWIKKILDIIDAGDDEASFRRKLGSIAAKIDKIFCQEVEK